MNEQAQLLAIADDELVLGWRDSEWTGIAPVLEEDVAFSSIAQNEIGHARAIYELLSEDADALAFDRAPDEYRCSPFVELRFVPDWAHTIARRVLYEAADEIRLRALMGSKDEAVAGLAAKIDREEAYHRMHAEMWHERLRDEPRYHAGAARALAVRARPRRARAARGARGALRARRVRAGRARHARGRVAGALGGDDGGAALRPGRVVVTADRGLGGARRGRGPRDPGDLAGRPRGRARRPGRGRTRARRVHADLPRLPGARGHARRRWPRRSRRSAREPDGRGGPRRLVVDRPDHAGGPREAPRRRLRPAGTA